MVAGLTVKSESASRLRMTDRQECDVRCQGRQGDTNNEISAEPKKKNGLWVAGPNRPARNYSTLCASISLPTTDFIPRRLADLCGAPFLSKSLNGMLFAPAGAPARPSA